MAPSEAKTMGLINAEKLLEQFKIQRNMYWRCFENTKKQKGRTRYLEKIITLEWAIMITEKIDVEARIKTFVNGPNERNTGT